jgi:hypothetical protein
MGTPNGRKLFQIEQMSSWAFYSDADEMNCAYEKHERRERLAGEGEPS